jgi:hypothetical protein
MVSIKVKFIPLGDRIVVMPLERVDNQGRDLLTRYR